ncbi:hypothetical protein [Sulfurimonas paralvinellae]|uniref:Lipoprotein n=1 Tax=Sulfurimonas paralvinellae TaxID=317658 RepID=A0A7M1B7H9_9BACT|nr:hypothetical protein [Sulfurimonas paralvinellae]QOP45699.1 hypothetical protein FM071_05135 [Sulfurimonas paralvinellae]
MLKSIIFFFTLLALSSCSSPHINQKDNNELNISYKNTVLISGNAKQVNTNKIYLSNINIYQSIYDTQNQCLTYEYAKATNGYKFSKGVKRSISIIFNTNAYNLEYQKGNLYFFTLQQDKKKLYLIVENINSSALKLIYGFEKESYDAIMASVKENKQVINNSRNKIKNNTVLEKDMSAYIQTKWSPKLIIIDQLVARPIGRGPVGR